MRIFADQQTAEVRGAENLRMYEGPVGNLWITNLGENELEDRLKPSPSSGWNALATAKAVRRP
jgi:hypothetical protein